MDKEKISKEIIDNGVDIDFDLTKSFEKTAIRLDRLQIIDADKEWEYSWISGRLKSTLFIKILECCEFKFSDFILINIFKTILFTRVASRNAKKTLGYLKPMINITSKEEADYIKRGFKLNPHNKKIYKRIVRAYNGKLNEKNVNRKLRNAVAGTSTKVFLRRLVDAFLTESVNEEIVIKELGDAVEHKIPWLFVFNYLVALYKGYDTALKIITLYGDTLDGELKVSIEGELVNQLAQFINNIPNNKINKDSILSNVALNVAVDLVDSENIQMQNDKAFYSQKCLESVDKILKLEDEIRNLKQELSFYKELYKNKLKGKKVLLIGDKKKEDEYKEIITSFNGQMQMLDSFDEFSKINSNTLNSFDYIILFTYYTSHSISDKLGKYNDKVFYVNSSSKLELEKTIVTL